MCLGACFPEPWAWHLVPSAFSASLTHTPPLPATAQLAEKRAREQAEAAEKAGKVELREQLKPRIDAWAAGKKVGDAFLGLTCCYAACCPPCGPTQPVLQASASLWGVVVTGVCETLGPASGLSSLVSLQLSGLG